MVVEESDRIERSGEERWNTSPSSSLNISSSSPGQSRVDITGIGVDDLNQREALRRIGHLIEAGGSHYGVVVNASKMVVASRDDRLRTAISKADMVTADGMSVVWASRLLGRSLKERVTGIDLFERLIGVAASQGASVYFLGAQPESVSGVVERFVSEYPHLRVAGYRDGYFTPSEEADVAAEINKSCADLLFVALGSPKQELWIYTFIQRTGVRFALGVGGAFDHLSGRVRRAPKWMQNAGLEWLYRLTLEPARLWRRYLIGNCRFIDLVVRQFLIQTRARYDQPVRSHSPTMRGDSSRGRTPSSADDSTSGVK